MTDVAHEPSIAESLPGERVRGSRAAQTASGKQWSAVDGAEQPDQGSIFPERSGARHRDLCDLSYIRDPSDLSDIGDLSDLSDTRIYLIGPISEVYLPRKI